MSPASLASYDFLVKFRETEDRFGRQLTFEPKYKFKDLSTEFDDDFLREHCYGGGLYCAVSNLTLESTSVLDEAIRQKCIYKVGKNNMLKRFWWNYIGNYRNCLKDKLANKSIKKIDCYDTVIRNMNMPDQIIEKVEACYQSSFSTPDNKSFSGNIVLAEDENSFEYTGIYLVPAFFINNNLVKEDLKLKVVVSAICDKLIDKPEMCHDLIMGDINWQYTKKMNNNNGLIVLLSLIVFGFIVILLTVVVVKRRMHSSIDTEIMDDIRSHVAEYMKLRDSND